MANFSRNVLLLAVLFGVLFCVSPVFGYTTVSNAIDANTTWSTGNTYYINANSVDGNLSVLGGATLTIEPGAVIKVGDNNYLLIENSAFIVTGSGGSDTNKITFTSCKDQTIGEDTSAEEGCSGSPVPGDYNYGISISSGAGSHAGTNLTDLNVYYAQIALNIEKDLNSVSDSVFVYNQNLALFDQNASAIFAQANVNYIHDNYFTKNFSVGGSSICLVSSDSIAIYNNTFIDNNAVVDTGVGAGLGISSGSTLGSLYGNTFSDNNAFAGGAITNLGTITSIYSNTFSDNNALLGGAIFNGGTITSLYSNQFLANTAINPHAEDTGYGAAIFTSNLFGRVPDIISIYDNNFSVNITDGYGVVYLTNASEMNDFYENTFSNNEVYLGAVCLSTDLNEFKNNSFSNNTFSLGGLVYHMGGTINYVHDNNFTDTSAVAYPGFVTASTIGDVYNNIFRKNTGEGNLVVITGGIIGNVYNNLFTENESAILIAAEVQDSEDPEVAGTINYVFNNTFAFNTTGAISDLNSASSTKYYNNIFVGNGYAVDLNVDSPGPVDVNYNAYWNNTIDVNNGSTGNHDVNFTGNPFLNDGSDLNYSVNPTMQGFVIDLGTSTGTSAFDSFFSTLSVRSDRIKDSGVRDIGHHFAGGIAETTAAATSGGGGTPTTSHEKTFSLKVGLNELNFATGVGDIITLKIYSNKKDSNAKIELETDSSKFGESVLFEDAYSVFEIVFSESNDSVDEVEFRFKVSKSWLEENGLSKNEVSLYRLVNGEWVELETEYSGEMDGYYIYTAISPGFSYFAIAESQGGQTGVVEEPVVSPPAPVEPIVQEPVEPIAPEPVEPVTNPVVPKPIEPIAPEPVETGSLWDLLLPMFVIGVALVGGTCFFFLRKGKKNPFSLK